MNKWRKENHFKNNEAAENRKSKQLLKKLCDGKQFLL